MRFVVVMAALASSCAYGQALDLKGIHLGKRHTPEEVMSKIGGSCGEGANSMTICNGPVTIAEVPADMNLVISKGGIVQRIHLNFSESSFEEVRDALLRKFGKPTSTASNQVQNAFGAKYVNETITWSRSDGTQLLVTRYAGNRERSSVYFSSIEDRKLLGDTRPNERAKDL